MVNSFFLRYGIPHMVMVCLICSSLGSIAQDNYNLDLISHPASICDNGYNDVWGFTHSNGIDYAVLGTRCGTAIYDLSNPFEPALVIDIPGAPGTWRDMKNFGDFIYVVAEQGSDGLLIIDMTNPDPDSITHVFYLPDVDGANLHMAHNIYIDTEGFIYLVGSNVNAGGIVVFDSNNGDLSPPLAGIGAAIYAHDVFVNEAKGIMISSEIFAGKFSIYSLVRTDDTVIITHEASQETARIFTHNAWTDDQGDVLFTTDERSNSFVEVWDISDLNDIVLLDQYTPFGAVGTGPLPHNVHVRGNHIIVSHYRQGVKIVDFSRPNNLVEIGSYLTSTSGSGCWGTFPHFANSEVILASDMGTGLFILQPNYSVSVAYMEGIVRDELGQAIDRAKIQIVANDSIFDFTKTDGSYATGMMDQTSIPTGFSGRKASNTVQVLVSKPGYTSTDTTLTLLPGQLLMQDFVLQKILPFELISFELDQKICEDILTWEVGALINHSHFEIQHSTDGQNYTTIGRRIPEDIAGNLYSFTWSDQSSQHDFYRLAHIDLDGTVVFSRALQVAHPCLEKEGILVFPNPVRKHLTFSSRGKPNNIHVYNSQGILVKKIDAMAQNQFSVSDLIGGVYFLMLEFKDETRVSRFLVVEE